MVMVLVTDQQIAAPSAFLNSAIIFSRNLYNNQLTGSIPESVGLLTDLIAL